MFLRFDGTEVYLGAIPADLRRIGGSVHSLLHSPDSQIELRGFDPSPDPTQASIACMIVRRTEGSLRAFVTPDGELVIEGAAAHLADLADQFDFPDDAPPGAHAALFYALHGAWAEDTISVVIGTG